MAKKTYFHSNPKRMLSCFLNELASKDIEQTNKQIKEIINRKKAKIRQLYANSSHEVIQQNLKPTRKAYAQFMPITPSAVQQEFISEKIKANVLTPERFYTREPNVKAGAYIQQKKWSLPEDRLILNQKFQEYSRIVDDQSGTVKHARLSQMLANYNPQQPKKSQYSRMKKTYFQKFIADKYNFYKPPSQHSIGLDSTSVLRKSRSKVIETLQTRINPGELRKELVSLHSRQIQGDLIEVRSARNRNRNKTTINRSRIKTIVHQKNIDSLD